MEHEERAKVWGDCDVRRSISSLAPSGSAHRTFLGIFTIPMLAHLDPRTRRTRPAEESPHRPIHPGTRGNRHEDIRPISFN